MKIKSSKLAKALLAEKITMINGINPSAIQTAAVQTAAVQTAAVKTSAVKTK